MTRTEWVERGSEIRAALTAFAATRPIPDESLVYAAELRQGRPDAFYDLAGAFLPQSAGTALWRATGLVGREQDLLGSPVSPAYEWHVTRGPGAEAAFVALAAALGVAVEREERPALSARGQTYTAYVWGAGVKEVVGRYVG